MPAFSLRRGYLRGEKSWPGMSIPIARSPQ